MKQFFNLSVFAILCAVIISSCSSDDDAPPQQDLPEIFTDVTLTFTPTNPDEEATVSAKAIDPDGEGLKDLEVQGPITLKVNTTYELTFDIENTLDPDADLNQEILNEDNEHQIFFAFTEGAFSNPTGDGNIGANSASDPLNYSDKDENGLPVGLKTSWTTSSTAVTGTFTANLKHQPDVKTDTSTSVDGDTDFKLTFVLNIVE